MREKLQTVYGAVFLALILIGIAGLCWSTFREGGWLERLPGIMVNQGMRHPLLIVPVTAGGLYAVSVFLRGGLKPGQGTALSQVWVYGLAASGLYYGYKWFVA